MNTMSSNTTSPTTNEPPMSQVWYDFVSDQWTLKIPSGAFMMFGRFEASMADIHIDTGLISYQQANMLCWKVFGASVENVMGPYSDIILDNEGWHGGWGSIPIPPSPTPPPPSGYKSSVKSPKTKKPQSIKSQRQGFGMTSVAGGLVSLLPLKTVRPLKTRKPSKKAASYVDDDCQSCSL